MKTIAFVPARGNSKGIKNKNIKLLNGKPLIFWCLRELQMCLSINEVYVATDSKKIKEIVKSFGFDKVVIYDRDPENAQDTSSTESVLLEFLSKYKFSKKDRFMLVQATSPLTRAYDFNEALKQFHKEKADSLLSGTLTKRFFWSKDGEPINYDYKSRPRRQEFEGTFQENGAIYISTVDNILKHKNRLSGKISTYIMGDRSSVELDTHLDWEVLEVYMRGAYPTNTMTPDLKLVLMDVDGVLTDGGMYYDQEGNELKKFNTSDGKAVEILRSYGIKVGIITSENTKIVKARSKKLKMDYTCQGIKNKLSMARDICEAEKISLDNVAYIGDDLNDLELLKYVGIAACPSTAQEEIRQLPYVIALNTAGGKGVIREFTRMVIRGILK